MRATGLLATILFLAACGGPAPAGSSPAAGQGASGGPAASAGSRALPPSIAALVDAARREGQVVVYGTASTPSEEEAIERAFRDYYGFALDLNFESGLHPQKVAELTTAARSGVRSGIDLFWSSERTLGDLDGSGLLRDGAWLAPLDLGPDDLLMRGKGARVHDAFLANLLYNAQRVKPEEAPRRYQDLLQPRWQGAIVMPRTSTPLIYPVLIYGEDAATEIVEGLVRQKVAFVPTYPEMSNRVASGEYLIGIGQHAEREGRKGAPLADAPLDVVVVIPWAVAMMADAEHPAGATLLAYFFTTPEGQRAIDQAWGISSSKAPDTSSWRVVQGKQVYVPSLEWLEREEARLRRKYADILGIR